VGAAVHRHIEPGFGVRLPSTQVVLFEGWMLGFSPVSSEAAAAVSPELVPVNEKLREYEQAWDSYCAAWLVIQVQDYNWVQKWRLQVMLLRPCAADCPPQSLTDAR
jgi:pantothenate kinase-related protein Tda10